jgi:hypothetical protein
MSHIIPAMILVPILCSAQGTKPSAPSKEEISELVAKAAEKVNAFEDAVKQVKDILEGQPTDLLGKDTSAAENAHKLIRGLQRNGPSAYALVALIATLDDISLNASRTATLVIMSGPGKIDAETQARLTLLWNAQNSCSDISEMLLHATLRLIQVEEGILNSIPADKK